MGKLSKIEFKRIVQDVAMEMSGILDFSVDVEFKTNSGKGSWSSTLNFDEETAYYTYTSPFPNAGSPYAFGDRIASRMK